MIERFNFYDVYGNLLPGIAFLTLFWLPLGVTRHLWPTTAISSAIVALAFAYFLGHILQSFASNVFPSRARDSKGCRRFPSSFFLDPEDPTFPMEFKGQLATEVEALFRLRLETTAYGGENRNIDRERRTAFFLCRGFLIREKIGSYGEQFEGLYALMRGLAISFWFATPYLLGWATSRFENQCFGRSVSYGLVISLCVAIIASGFSMILDSRSDYLFRVDVIAFVAVLFLFFCGGFIYGKAETVGQEQALVLAMISAGAFLAGERCFRAYKYYAGQFAKAIWQDFLGHRMLAVSDSAQEESSEPEE